MGVNLSELDNHAKVRAMNIASACRFVLQFVIASLFAGVLQAEQPSGALVEGTTFDLGGRRAIVKKLDTLPYVESDYTKRFKFDSYENPKLKQLREQYRLDEVIAPGKDEFDKQVLLM